MISAATKSFASDVAMHSPPTPSNCSAGNGPSRPLCAGYTTDFPVKRMLRDAKITQIYEGANQIRRFVMSRALLGRSAEHSHEPRR